jgi:sphingomyelin phosphodiesterase acid-like 3
MKHNFPAPFPRVIACQLVALLGLFLIAGAACAQSGKSAAKPAPAHTTVSALVLSDIHFEPFWDPVKVPQLAAAPVSEWKAILAAAPSPDQQQRFAALQQTCRARGADTSFALFDSS